MTATLTSLLDISQSNVSIAPGINRTLAEHLDVDEDTLTRLGVGWVPIVEFKDRKDYRGWWAIPERDANGEVVGLSLRSRNGDKVMYPGSKRGLVFEANPDHKSSTVTYQQDEYNWVRTKDAGIECPVCGKPDGCLLSKDDPEDPSAVICIREEDGSKRTMKLGHLHVLKETRNRRVKASVLPNSDYPVVVVEGMTDTAAAMGLGFVAVGRPSNIGGLDQLATLVRGRQVIIVGENDEKPDGFWPGREGMLAAAEAVSRTATDIVTMMPPSDCKDLRSWITAHGLNQTSFLEHVEKEGRSYEQMSSVNDGVSPIGRKLCPKATQFIPFPVDELPQPLSRFVKQGAKAIGCDPSYIALPLLSALAAAIGNSRRVRLKNSYVEPSIVWALIIGESGTKKSPPLELALRPIHEREQQATYEHEIAMEDYALNFLQYESDLLAWKRKNQGDPPSKPQEPVMDRFCCKDTTVEALAVLLMGQPRGLLLARDELNGWLGSFDRYTSVSGADSANYLEMFGGRSLTVDRKAGKPPTINVPRASVSITGTIQPATLIRSLGRQNCENGLAARFLMAYPPRIRTRWTDDDVSDELQQEIADIFDRLYSLQPETKGKGGYDKFCPIDIPFSEEGRNAYKRFFNEHGQEQDRLTGDLAAAWSKLAGYAARLALIIQFVRWANDDMQDIPELIDADSVDAAVALVKWFGNEARRIYGGFDGSKSEREHRELIEWVRRQGGRVTTRDVNNSGPSCYRDSSEIAEKALSQLVKDEYGYWQPSPTSDRGGRPTRYFMMYEDGDCDTTPKNTGNDEVSSHEPISSCP